MFSLNPRARAPNETESTIQFVWDTSGFRGNYTLSAFAEPVSLEFFTTDNTFIGEVVWVTWPYDVTGDNYCGIDDIVAVAEHFGTSPGHPNWNPIYDINDDDNVGIDDIVSVAEHFGESA